MLNHLHASVAMFPLPILLLSFICESASYFGDQKVWRYLSSIMILACAALTVCSYQTGVSEAAFLQTEDSNLLEIISSHQSIGKLFLISLLPTVLFAFLRNFSSSEMLHWLFVPCLVISLLTCTLTSLRGINMVFDHAIGVKVPMGKLPDEKTIDQNVSNDSQAIFNQNLPTKK
jgi:uncharacterized membrane protein